MISPCRIAAHFWYVIVENSLKHVQNISFLF